MCENSPLRQHTLGRQEPKGCRYIYGDPGHGEWHFCQRTIKDGGVAGDARHPPYCSHHHRTCTVPLNHSYLSRYLSNLSKDRSQGAFANAVEQNVIVCPENRGDGQRMPVDFLLKITPTGALTHD